MQEPRLVSVKETGWVVKWQRQLSVVMPFLCCVNLELSQTGLVILCLSHVPPCAVSLLWVRSSRESLNMPSYLQNHLLKNFEFGFNTDAITCSIFLSLSQHLQQKKEMLSAHLSHVLDKDYTHRLICYLQKTSVISSVDGLGGSQHTVTADVGSCLSEFSQKEPCRHGAFLACAWLWAYLGEAGQRCGPALAMHFLQPLPSCFHC